MQDSSVQRAAEHTTRNRHRRVWKRAVGVLSCLVVFVTTYALILPAITMEREPLCGLDVHTHTDDCYEIELIEAGAVLDCPFELHQHSGACYDAEGELICGQADFAIHTHNKNCYDEGGELRCALPEVEEHEHTGDCCTETRTLICEQEEDRGHKHGASCRRFVRDALICELAEHDHVDTCYEWVEELICPLEEREPGHVHDELCYEITQELTCREEEILPHTHGEDCFDDAGDLICGQLEILEHRHTEDCLSVPQSEPEEVKVLICELAEHAHTDKCYPSTEPVPALPSDSDLTAQPTVSGEAQPEPSEPEPSAPEQTQEPEETPPIEGEPEETPTTDGEPEETPPIEGEPDENVPAEDDPAPEESPADPTETPAPEESPQEPDRVDDGEEDAYFCGLPGHIHEEYCFDAEGELICELDEHIHDAECEIPDEEWERIDAAADLIAALPDGEEIADVLSACDEEEYNAYLTQITLQAQTAYALYEDLGPELWELVPNRDELLALEWLWSAATLEVKATLPVYQVNKYSSAATTLVYGGSVQNKLGSGMLFTYWDVIVVEKNSAGKLYVAQYVTADGDKRSYKASTSDGFVLLLHNTSVNTSVGDEVTVDFDYKTTTGYNSSGYGKVSFGSTAPKVYREDLDEVEGEDTRSFIEINLYDYGSNINEPYNKDSKYPGFQQDNGTTIQFTSFNGSSFNFGNNITEDLAAGKTGVTNGTGINSMYPDDRANRPIFGEMQTTLGTDGYPALADGTSLKYLFSDNDYATKKNKQSVNGLFLYNNTTGAYTFNSRTNHAQYNPKDDTFTLYKQIITSNFMMYPFGNFLPFNDITQESAQASKFDRDYLQAITSSAKEKSNGNDEYSTLATRLTEFISLMDKEYGTGWKGAECATQYFETAGIEKKFTEADLSDIYSIDFDEPTDFYFGMEMKMNFVQPKNGLTGKDGKQPMVFYFTGDDDVWVYIDGVLFLDLSGIHRHVGGEIDFVNGQVHYYKLDVSTGDVSTKAYKTVSFAEILGSNAGLNEKGAFEDYSSHTFNFYYMERGAGSGVCRMNFNFPLLHKNSISVSKELSVDDGLVKDLLGDPDFKFQILKENGTDLFIGPGVEYDIQAADGKTVGTGKTGADGVFTLKAGQTAVFKGIEEDEGKYFVQELLDPKIFAQYGTISVNGSSVTTNYDVTVGSDTFMGVRSPVKDMSDGSTVFQFNNCVSSNKLGTLRITKKLEPAGTSETDLQFQFRVTLDGEPIAKGTPYQVGDQTKYAEKGGILTLAPGETALISKILAGTTFTVEELAESAKGYHVTYHVDGKMVDGAGASGVITVSSNVEITIVNGGRYELPATGGAGTFWYTLGGTALILGAVFLLFYQFHWRGKGGRDSPR